MRRWLLSKLKLFAVVSLPIETFSAYGANIKTSLLIGRKWKRGEKREDSYDVLMCKIENIGYDGSGKLKSDGDIQSAVDVLNDFRDKRGW